MKAIITIMLFCFTSNCLGQLKEVTFKHIDSLNLNKPTLIFLHTKWCKSCLSFKKNTLTDPELIKQLNNHYYFIPFNAESKQSIIFNKISYNYKSDNKKNGIHQLAEYLGRYKHKISYPTLVFLDRQKQIVFRSTSKLKAKGILNLMKELKKHEKL